MKKVLGVFLTTLLVVSTFTLPAAAKVRPLDSDGDFSVYNGELMSYDGSGGAVTIPNDVTSIGEAFNSAQGATITSITIPDTVTELDYGAFAGCTNIKSITIPKSVSKMDGSIFDGCTNLSNVVFQNSSSYLGDDAFEDCTSLTNIVLPIGATVIGSSAFYGCTALTNVTIPNTVTSIGNFAFMGCKNLKSATITSTVTSIGGMAFSNCADDFLLNCNAGSYAETYAKNNYLNYSTKLVSISVLKKPTKVNYKKGQSLNLSGGSLTVVYADGSTKKISMTSAAASGFTSSKKGKQTITLKYKGISCKLAITVS